ncbi:CerR family C-terminal domain-containing protein [Sphingomonas hengshuiensis]|uniref:HTH tetR-type domain-containing protein n=1 Tax=Sphingomonas hengshuiensis TaxID=1609977 RepID=A0A7U4J7V6_9SPHN|nr:CerR family C-terminal domain-containing protein [Sphingomonas hengshuiensis]AJP71752.1 hypothetical protein TS85_08075 [Sphingomonas hengshuiensis]
MVQHALLETAIDRFGRVGFEGASTRDIAHASGTAMSSITYHFGGKQGLYLAAADYIAAAMADRLTPALTMARTACEGTHEDATEALLQLLDNVAAVMMLPESATWSAFVVREQQNPTEAFDRLYAGVIQRVVDVFIALITRIRPDLPRREALATGLLLFGQALVLRVCRATVCRVLGTDTLDESTQTLLRARLRANALCILSETP